jgi:hypothetical protein
LTAKRELSAKFPIGLINEIGQNTERKSIKQVETIIRAGQYLVPEL